MISPILSLFLALPTPPLSHQGSLLSYIITSQWLAVLSHCYLKQTSLILSGIIFTWFPIQKYWVIYFSWEFLAPHFQACRGLFLEIISSLFPQLVAAFSPIPLFPSSPTSSTTHQQLLSTISTLCVSESKKCGQWILWMVLKYIWGWLLVILS